MQHISAFSRPQTVPAVPAAVPKRNLWILDSWRDLVLYVGTPLLLMPLFAVAQARWSGQDIYLFVAALGSMGHHLPGMIRAYGDRALFQRFRWRFLFAPIFLLGTCIAFYTWDLNAIFLVVFFWGVWHGMMQTYGFCRIYDAKTGSFAVRTRRLDFAVCGTWFATAVLFSGDRMMTTLNIFYASGGPYIPRSGILALQYGVLGLTIIVTALFLLNLIQTWLHGQRPNPVKLALLITTISFWWYCNDLIVNILAGIALFEVFHDVQYLSLVWIYNRNRVEKDNTIGGFMRFVFRRSGALIGLYVALVLVYGSFGYVTSFLGVSAVKRALMGFVAASGLLHFYYDGFIWKVRERSTRESLGLTGGTPDVTLGGLLPAWATHAGKWVGAFVLPLAALGFLQLRGTAPEVVRQAWVMSDLPSDAGQHHNYADVLYKAGRGAEAAEQYRAALEADPNSAASHYKLGTVLLAESKIEAALAEFEAAVRLDPADGESHYDRAYALQRLGRQTEAGAAYQAAARLAPKSERVHNGYAAFLQSEGRIDEAISERRQALRHSPNSFRARLGLGKLLFQKGELDEAKKNLLEAIKIDSKNAEARHVLGKVHFQQGETSRAIVQFSEALRLQPDFPEAQEDLRSVQANDDRSSTPIPK
ncbi:MAG TPA: tetratricopeptide repeat protein [Chthoniobacterales bacterium]|nr:tetratricopeptide repeat protein [Chthoniobacterales bacterium]